MIQVGDKVIIFHTHGYNESNPIWEVIAVSQSGKQLTIKKGSQEEQVSLRKGGYYALSGIDGGKYTRIYFEGDEMFTRYAAIIEDVGSKNVMPDVASELLKALQVFVDKFEELEPITPQDYADAKNAIARAMGKPLPFLERYKLKSVQEGLERLL